MTLSSRYKRIKSKKESTMEIDSPTAVEILEEQMKKIVLKADALGSANLRFTSLEPTMLVNKAPTKRRDRMSAMGIPKKIHKAELINTNLLLT